MAHGWETEKPAFRVGRNSVLSLCSSVSFGVSFQSSRTDTTETNCLSASRISRLVIRKLVDQTSLMRVSMPTCSQRFFSGNLRTSGTPNSSVILRCCREFPLEIGTRKASSERRYADNNLLAEPEREEVPRAQPAFTWLVPLHRADYASCSSTLILRLR